MAKGTVLVVAPQHHVTEQVTRHVHEHRAPTDESVKLLREMEDKAREQIIEAVHVGDTTFECVIHTYKQAIDMSTMWIAIYSLNGKKLTTKVTTGGMFIEKMSPQAQVEALRDAIARDLATEVLLPALRNLKIT